MRRRMILRRPRAMRAAFGAMILGVPTSAAFADAPHGTQAASSASSGGSGLEAQVHAHRIGFGRSVVVTGRAPAADAGQSVVLEYAPAGSSSWQQVASSPIAQGGGFRLSAPLQSSGEVKVTTESAVPAAVTGAGSSSTAPEHVAVAAGIRIHRRLRTVFGSGTIGVHGRLLPRAAGRRVVLQDLRDGHWVTLAAARTRWQGRFGFRYQLDVPGRQALRVRFAGNRDNASVSGSAGRVIVFRQSVASWYNDAGTTGCGFHATYGVANLSLPCGTQVTFSYGGRRVTATVDDRGPYVGGREWDLNQNTAAALGFGGVGTVWSSS